MDNTTSSTFTDRILNDPEYRGKHVVVVDGQVFTASTGEGARQILERVRREFPGITPTVTYIPEADALVLWQW